MASPGLVTGRLGALGWPTGANLVTGRHVGPPAGRAQGAPGRAGTDLVTGRHWGPPAGRAQGPRAARRPIS
jgi:hypothetical protein